MNTKSKKEQFLMIFLAFMMGVIFTNICYSAEVAEDGQAISVIIVPSDPSSAELFAAEELQKYLNKITTAEFIIHSEGESKGKSKIYIGHCNASKKFISLLNSNEPDCFAVKSSKNNLHLFGVSDRATLYAVYDFLEDDLGFRWLAPGPQWEDIIEQKSITLKDFERIECPDIRYRYQCFTFSDEGDTYRNYCLDWAVKQKINIGSIWPPDHEIKQISERGGFLGCMWPHSMTSLFDCDKAFKEHPEWFALVNGKRTKKDNPYYVNFCTTNEELIGEVVKSLRKTFDKWPKIEFLPLGPGDGWWFCGCDKCRSLDVEGKTWPDHRGNKVQVLTERWLTFVNRVSAELKKTHPNKKLYTIAYHQTFPTPEPDIIKPFDNVMIQVVNCRPNYVCFLHEVTRNGCPKNVKFCVGFEEWAKITPAGLMVYQYAPHSQFCYMPYPAVHKFVNDIKYMSKYLIGHETQTGIGCFGFYTPALIACAKTSWDTDTDADELIEDYCKRAYHESAEPMIKLIHLFEEGLDKGGHSSFGIWPGFNDDLLLKAQKLLNEAKSMAKSDIVKYRLESADVHMNYSEKAYKAWKMISEAAEKNDEQLKDKAIAIINEATQTTIEKHDVDPLKINFYAGSWICRKYDGVWLNRNRPEVRN